MFTGIIESTGKILSVLKEGGNLRFLVQCSFAAELKPGQSVSHNGVCLTVEHSSGTDFSVVAVKETLEKTNLGDLGPADLVNLERAMKAGDRMDGHLVQGHVDSTVLCRSVERMDGSWLYHFETDGSDSGLIVEKGSVCLDGVSLTVVECDKNFFSVTIIPFTYEHTNFRTIKPGTKVNVEYDILGKYVKKQLELTGLKNSERV